MDTRIFIHLRHLVNHMQVYAKLIQVIRLLIQFTL